MLRYTYLKGKYLLWKETYFIFVEYENDKLAELFSDLNDVKHSNHLLQKNIGFDLTRSIKKRYNQILSCSSFKELQQSGLGKPESLSGNFTRCFSLRLTANYRLIVKPCSKDLSAESLMNCDTVIIKGVIDYHGKGNDWIIP